MNVIEITIFPVNMGNISWCGETNDMMKGMSLESRAVVIMHTVVLTPFSPYFLFNKDLGIAVPHAKMQ